MSSRLLLASLLTVIAAGKAEAHRLEAEYRVLPGRRVQIESWFDLTGDSPKGARVEVFGHNGQLLTEGQLSDKGIFVFSYAVAERLKVVVSAGAGHRKELEISAADLSHSPTGGAEMPSAGEPGANSVEPTPFADRSPRVSLKDVMIGIGFLLALAAFVLSVRNARRLGELMRRGPVGENGGAERGGHISR